MDFITAEEKTLLEQRLSELRANDKVLIQRIAEARALGDLRENAEYHASREDKAMNDAKIKELEERLATAQVADSSAMPADMVFVGRPAAWRQAVHDRRDRDVTTAERGVRVTPGALHQGCSTTSRVPPRTASRVAVAPPGKTTSTTT
ncbi:MAG: hypothetical protein LW636_07935 [Planctomycetaceae bacterium]|nr:hypothetical protein [Planctomycetaceae bacterium]